MLRVVQEEFQAFKDEQAIKDLLVVKFDIDTIDEDLLTAKDTKIEDLENQKLTLEKKIQQVLGDLDLKLANEEDLSTKVRQFQTKCSDLE